MDADNVIDAFMSSASASESGKEQVSMRLQTFVVELAKRWADAEGKPYQEILRDWATKGLWDTLRESLVIHWYYNLLENGKVHAGFESPRVTRYYREEEKGKLSPLRSSLDIWFGREHLGYLHAIASRLVEVAAATQNALAKSRRRLQGSFFYVTRVPMLALVEVHGNLGKDETGFETMDSVLSSFQTGAMTWVQKVIEEGSGIVLPEEGDRRERERALAAESLRALNQRQVGEGLNTLRANLETLLEKGIIDEMGNRKRRRSSQEGLGGRADVV